jgi:hypothetical protein
LTIASAAAQPTENRTAAAIQAQGVGATAIVGVQADSHLNVIMQQRASMNGPAPQAFAQGNAALHISTGISASQTSMQFNAASMHGTPAAAGMNRAITTATPQWPVTTGRWDAAKPSAKEKKTSSDKQAWPVINKKFQAAKDLSIANQAGSKWKSHHN